MTKNKSILIKNIYYMLAYAFQELRQNNYDDIKAETFDNILDLFAAILLKGASQKLKQGLYRDYITNIADLPLIKGKLCLHESLKSLSQKKKLLACEYDELSPNTIFNQILKTTINLLSHDKNVKSTRKTDLQQILKSFNEIDIIDLSVVNWNNLPYHRYTMSYKMLINICYFVVTSVLPTTEKGAYRMASFIDSNMPKLFERFVLEYYKQEYNKQGRISFSEIKSAYIEWDVSSTAEECMIQYLPSMKTDIFLKHNNQILIIDTKYYSKTMQQQFDKTTIRSAHLYQIFAYVKNQDSTNTGDVSGLILYAKTDEDITPDFSYIVGRNKISVKTLDLNQEFSSITAQLDSIINTHFIIQSQHQNV